MRFATWSPRTLVTVATIALVAFHVESRDLPKVFKVLEGADRSKESNLCPYLGVEGMTLKYNMWTCRMPRKTEHCGLRTKFVYDCCPGFIKSELVGGKCAEIQSVWRLIPDYLKTYGYPKFGNLLETVEASKLLSINTTKEAHSVFVPYDENLLTSGNVNLLTTSVNPHPVLKNVVKERIYSVDMKDGVKLESLHSQKTVKITVYSNDLIFIECRALIKPNLEARNGLIHVVSGPLPVHAAPNVLKTLEGDPDSSEFAKDLPADVKQKLSNANSRVWYTVFAPKSSQWKKIKAKYTDKKDIETIASNHVMERMICSEAITQTSSSLGPTMAKQYVGVSCSGADQKRFMVDASGQNIPILGRDAMSGNGVLHIIDGVLVPTTVMNLEDALGAYGLRADINIRKSIEQLKECGISLTSGSSNIVLVPLESAHAWFQGYQPFANEYKRFTSDNTYRCNVYRYHILQTAREQIQNESPALWNQNAYTTLYNLKGAFSVNYHVKYRQGSELFFEYAIAKDHKAYSFKNGFIYFMNRINVIPEKTRLEVMQGRSELSTIVSKVGSANYGSLLTQKGPFSLFLAPRNKGWSGRGEAKYTGDSLTNFLRLHTVRLRLWGNDLGYFERETLQSVETELVVEGKQYQLQFKRGLDGNMFVGHEAIPIEQWAMVLEWNLYGTDGIVWIIDWPIACPPGVCDAVVPDLDVFVVYATSCGLMQGVATPREYNDNPLVIARKNANKCVVFKLPPQKSYKEWNVKP